MASVLRNDISPIPVGNCLRARRANHVRSWARIPCKRSVGFQSRQPGRERPRTDPGVRVRDPEVGSLTSRLLSDVCHRRAERRRATPLPTGAPILRNSNVRREKASKCVGALLRILTPGTGELSNMLEGMWSPWRLLPSHLPLVVVSHLFHDARQLADRAVFGPHTRHV